MQLFTAIWWTTETADKWKLYWVDKQTIPKRHCSLLLHIMKLKCLVYNVLVYASESVNQENRSRLV